jgi:hypothetical protein
MSLAAVGTCYDIAPGLKEEKEEEEKMGERISKDVRALWREKRSARW